MIIQVITSYFVIVLCGARQSSIANNGIIWNKTSESFIPIYSIRTFAAVREDVLLQSRELEIHNFHGEVFKVTHYEEPRLVSFYANNTKITGLNGMLWMMLAKYLNFTLVTSKLRERNFGIQSPNGSYNGILGSIQRGDSQIILRTGIHNAHLSFLDFTIPLYKVRLYIRPKWRHDEWWMYNLFEPKLWCALAILICLIPLAAYLLQVWSENRFKSKRNNMFSLRDHLFYTFAVFSSKGSIPDDLHNRTKLIYISLSMFSWLILIAFSSHAILSMMNKSFHPPFRDIKSLFRNSEYNLVAFRGSMVYESFKEEVKSSIHRNRDISRVSFFNWGPDMFKRACLSEKKEYAFFESEDRIKAIGKDICNLVPVGASYFETWITSAVNRGSKYKRSFDVGIMKFTECGLIDGLREQWLEWKLEHVQHNKQFESIKMNQVYFIFLLLFLGMVTSTLILSIEIVTSKVKRKNNRIVVQVMVNDKNTTITFE